MIITQSKAIRKTHIPSITVYESAVSNSFTGHRMQVEFCFTRGSIVFMSRLRSLQLSPHGRTEVNSKKNNLKISTGQ